MIHAFLLAVGAMFGLMSPPAHGTGGGGGGCGSTSCITTESSSDLQTESASDLVTET